MAERKLTIVGGGSAQWVPTLVEDFALTPVLDPLRLTLYDIDEARAGRTAAFAAHVAEIARRTWTVEATSDQDVALRDADFVVVCISTGGLSTMANDLELSARSGVPMPIGDTVGPAGISRAWRNVPVLVALARTMERLCPAAWLLNVTNPLTALTRAVLNETTIRAVGLCHEVTNTQFFLSQLLDCNLFDVRVEVSGVNHLPLITSVTVKGDDRWPQLLELAHGGADAEARLPLLDQVLTDPPITTGGAGRPMQAAGGWTKQGLIDHQGVNYEILRRFGALPGADRDHTCEFFPGLVRDPAQAERRWGIELVTVEARAARERQYVSELERKTRAPQMAAFRSMEMVAPVIESLSTGEPCELPLNVTNTGQCPDLPMGAVVESICTVDGEGIRGRDVVRLPPFLAEWARRVAASQELTVGAACRGDPDELLGALLSDPLTSRLEHDAVVSLRDEIVAVNAPWRQRAVPPPSRGMATPSAARSVP